jgi:hypothetical protein
MCRDATVELLTAVLTTANVTGLVPQPWADGGQYQLLPPTICLMAHNQDAGGVEVLAEVLGQSMQFIEGLVQPLVDAGMVHVPCAVHV